MSFFTKYYDEKVGEYMSHVRPEIAALAERGQVTWAEYDAPMNSYERELILPKLVDTAFLKALKYYVENCGRHERPRLSRPSRCYDDAVMNVMLPELIRRFEERVRIPSGVRAVLRSGKLNVQIRTERMHLLEVPRAPTNAERHELLVYGLTEYDLTDEGLERIFNLPIGFVQ